MTTDLGSDFIDRYLGINNLLKKRFMRKPNVSEATGEFCNLAVQCELSEQPPFAGLCYLGAARCEGSIGNSTAEAEYLLLSARQFMNAEIKLKSLKCFSPARENVEAAISCYMHVSCRYPEVSPLRASLSLELAEFLERLGYLREAVEHYKNSILYLPDNLSHKISCLQKIAGLQIMLKNYDGALDTHDEILEEGKKYNNWLLNKKCEINTILLVLLTKPVHKRVTKNIQNIINLCSKDISICQEESSNMHLNGRLLVNMQSLFIAYQMCDIDSIVSLQINLKKDLNVEQQGLLHAIIKKNGKIIIIIFN